MNKPRSRSAPADANACRFFFGPETCLRAPRRRFPADLPPVEATVEGPAWYVIHCYSGYENKVRHNLEQRIETMGMKDKIFDVVIPTQEEIEVKDGKRRTVERHIFPAMCW